MRITRYEISYKKFIVGVGQIQATFCQSFRNNDILLLHSTIKIVNTSFAQYSVYFYCNILNFFLVRKNICGVVEAIGVIVFFFVFRETLLSLFADERFKRNFTVVRNRLSG